MFEFCIRRPVFATVLSLVLVLLGVVSYGRLTVREYPNVDEPVVSVSINYPGASASIVESQITAGAGGLDRRHRRHRRAGIDQPRRDQPHHRALQVGRGPGRGGERRARPGEPRAPPPARRGAGAEHRQGRGRRPGDHEPGVHLRPHDGPGDHRLRRPLRARPAQEPERRRRRDDLRRAPLCHAHLDRPGAAGGLQSHRPGRGERAHGAERGAAVGPHREPSTASSRCSRAPAS